VEDGGAGGNGGRNAPPRCGEEAGQGQGGGGQGPAGPEQAIDGGGAAEAAVRQGRGAGAAGAGRAGRAGQARRAGGGEGGLRGGPGDVEGRGDRPGHPRDEGLCGGEGQGAQGGRLSRGIGCQPVLS